MLCPDFQRRFHVHGERGKNWYRKPGRQSGKLTVVKGKTTRVGQGPLGEASMEPSRTPQNVFSPQHHLTSRKGNRGFIHGLQPAPEKWWKHKLKFPHISDLFPVGWESWSQDLKVIFRKSPGLSGSQLNGTVRKEENTKMIDVRRLNTKLHGKFYCLYFPRQQLTMTYSSRILSMPPASSETLNRNHNVSWKSEWFSNISCLFGFILFLFFFN